MSTGETGVLRQPNLMVFVCPGSGGEREAEAGQRRPDEEERVSDEGAGETEEAARSVFTCPHLSLTVLTRFSTLPHLSHVMFVVSPGELLRKKRREKGGHKDPLLQEISHLQEEVMTQISNLRKEHEAAEKKRNEIDKVALILGLSPSDRPRRTSKPAEDQEDEALPLVPPEKKKREAEGSPEGRQAASSAVMKVQTPAEQVNQFTIIARAHYCHFLLN